eukprot:365885-Chlamydomonas_euryale.AAC.9
MASGLCRGGGGGGGGSSCLQRVDRHRTAERRSTKKGAELRGSCCVVHCLAPRVSNAALSVARRRPCPVAPRSPVRCTMWPACRLPVRGTT